MTVGHWLSKASIISALVLLLLPAAATSATALKKIFIAGDSTAATYNDPDQQGWGAVLGDYLDSNKAQVMNRARGGRSTRTYISEGLWQALNDEVEAGDIVIIQFGHNDASPVNDESRARGTLPGIGDEAVTIDNLLTGRQETVLTFGQYLRVMVNDVRAKNAIPILMSLTQRNVWQGSKLQRNGNYGRWAYEIALELDTHFVDLNNLVADKLEALGEEKTNGFYPKDHTHFNHQGAVLHAETALTAFKGLRPEIFAGFLNESGELLARDEATWLRLPMPANNHVRSIYLIGDSTVRNGRADGASGEWGWGDYLHRYLDTQKVNVVNRAVGGLSSRTFYTGNYWQRTLNMMRPGDALVLQFGHNDSDPINDDRRARGTLKGYADNFEQINNLLTGTPETVYSYGTYLRRFIGEARVRGIDVVVCSPVPRKFWTGRNIERNNSYARWARVVAMQSGASFIDLHQLVASEYDKLGPRKVDSLFADKHTHTSQSGAELNAQVVAEELKPLLGL